MPDFSITHIVAADIPRVSQYLETKSGGVYTKQDWMRILEWIWINNPNVETSTILGWLITDGNDTIHGVLGNIAAKCVVDGVVHPSYWATSWFVDEDARKHSLELFMNYVKQGGLLMSNTPNPSVETMLVKAFKYKRADSPWFTGSFLFPVKPLKDFFSARKNNAPLLKRAALTAASVLLKIPQAFVFFKGRANKTFRGISVACVDNFSSETDEWFEAFSRQHRFAMNRSAAMYRWIFLDRSNRSSFKPFEIRHAGKILGYLVFKTKYNATSGFHYMELVDEALLPMDDALLRQVIIKTYYKANLHASHETFLIMRSNNEKVKQVLRGLFGIAVNKVEKTYYKQSFLKTDEQPFLTSLDGDSIFF